LKQDRNKLQEKLQEIDLTRIKFDKLKDEERIKKLKEALQKQTKDQVVRNDYVKLEKQISELE
jgi:hypothetical protein